MYFNTAWLKFSFIFLADPGCVDYVPSTEYNGNLSVTVNGRQCQVWSSIYPYNDTLEDDNRFPMDGSVIAAKNFCRDPTNDGNIWCYTNEPGVVWEYCSFRPCMYYSTYYPYCMHMAYIEDLT